MNNLLTELSRAVLGPLVAALGAHCHDLGPIFHIITFHPKVPNNVNFILTEQSGAHSKHPNQMQQQSERWTNEV